MINEGIELIGSTKVEKNIFEKIKVKGIRGLDVEKAQELGVFQRISNLLCVMHASIMAAYRIYGGVDYLLGEMQCKRLDIAKAMNDFEKSYDKFVRFWSDYYAKGEAGKEMNMETEKLFKLLMDWAQLPEQWNLGDEQRKDNDYDTVMRVNVGENDVINFYRNILEHNIVGDVHESWCVTKLDANEVKQTTVNTDMDKASAIMVAKRLSAEDKDSFYTASKISEITEKRTEVMPFKAYHNGENVGNITKN